jgi:hypothetical protein
MAPVGGLAPSLEAVIDPFNRAGAPGSSKAAARVRNRRGRAVHDRIQPLTETLRSGVRAVAVRAGAGGACADAGPPAVLASLIVRTHAVSNVNEV